MKVKGPCIGCKKSFTSAKGGLHLSACSKISQFLQKSPSSASGYLLKVSSAEAPAIFWMFLTVPSNATLHLLDRFLRQTWLECCGHMSMFTIAGKHYSSYPNEEDLSMRKRVDKVFIPGLNFDYIYDFGSSTDLKIKVVDEVEQCPQKQITLLMQNEPPPFDCERCKKSANIICSLCGETICNFCSERHSCVKEEKDTYMLMHLVNSPRTGVCGYEGNDW